MLSGLPPHGVYDIEYDCKLKQWQSQSYDYDIISLFLRGYDVQVERIKRTLQL